MGFWIVAGAMALAAGLMLGLALRRGKAVGASETVIYRDQLAEVDRDLARGVIAPDEAARIRTEVSRRLLDADRAARGQTTAIRQGGLWAMPVVGVVLAASFGGYLWLGAPGYPDVPLARRIAAAEEYRQTRPSQQQAEAQAPAIPPVQADQDYLALVDKLRAAVKERPDDTRGLSLLARNEAGLGNFIAASEAQARLVAAKGAEATAEDHAALAELMIMAAGGYVSPEAEAALVRALSADPHNRMARYYSGLMFNQVGRPDQAFRLWRPLLEESPPDEPWVAPIRSQIQETAWRAGVSYELPPEGAPLAGPSAADIEASADMTPEDRQQMIRGMVDGLMARLAAEGGTADEWARLITSLAVIGDQTRARSIWTEAQTRFATRPADLAVVRQAAEEAGLLQ